MAKISDLMDSYKMPKALKEGATIGITAPSSQVDLDRITRGKKFLESLGYKVILGDTVLKVQDTDFTSAPRNSRIKEIHDMFTDSSIDAIITACGGYGTQTIVAELDYNLIANNPKIIMGFSDATALLNAITEKCRFYTFLGPTIEIVSKEADEYSMKCALELLQKTEPWGELENPASGIVRRFNEPYKKVATGRLVGGNLTMMSVTMGTPYEIDTANRIVLIEEVGETPYEIERTTQHLASCGKLDHCAGVIIGEFVRLQQERSDGKSHQASPSANEILKKHFSNKDYPVLSDYRFSHGVFNMVLPIGGLARINSDNRTLTVIESVLK